MNTYFYLTSPLLHSILANPIPAHTHSHTLTPHPSHKQRKKKTRYSPIPQSILKIPKYKKHRVIDASSKRRKPGSDFSNNHGEKGQESKGRQTQGDRWIQEVGEVISRDISGLLACWFFYVSVPFPCRPLVPPSDSWGIRVSIPQRRLYQLSTFCT